MEIFAQETLSFHERAFRAYEKKKGKRKTAHEARNVRKQGSVNPCERGVRTFVFITSRKLQLLPGDERRAADSLVRTILPYSQDA